MRVILCGRKRIALFALDHILNLGYDVLAVLPGKSEPDWMETPHFAEGVLQRDLPHTTQRALLAFLSSGHGPEHVREFIGKPVDLVISYLFPERIKTPLLKLPTMAAINFHPAPLPEYGGLAGYNYAILEQRRTYGVTAHHMDWSFDTGEIILRKEFEFDCETATAFDLERMTRPFLLEAFKEVIGLIESGNPLPRIPQHDTRYVNKAEFEASKVIRLSHETPEEIERKVRAFWYPPYDGAHLDIGGRKFNLIPREKLVETGKRIHRE